jgi:hypothetical protein
MEAFYLWRQVDCAMQKQEQHFGYRPPQKQLKLLTLAWFLTAGALLIGGFYSGQEPLKIWEFTFLSPYSNLIQWVGGLILLFVGWVSGKQARDLKNRWLQMTIHDDAIVLIDPKDNSESRLCSLAILSWFRVVEKAQGRTLELRDPHQRLTIASEDMASSEEFDGLIELLRQRFGTEKERR